MFAVGPLNKTFYFHFPNCTFRNEYLNNSDINFIIHLWIHLLSSDMYADIEWEGVKKQLTALGAFFMFHCQFFSLFALLIAAHIYLMKWYLKETAHNCVYMRNKKFMCSSLTTVNFWYSKTIFHFSVFMSKLFMIKEREFAISKNYCLNCSRRDPQMR